MKTLLNLKKISLFTLCLCLLLVSLTSAKRTTKKTLRPLPLTSVHVVDRNGFSETISNKERLAQFQNVDFLTTQPYQKVLRIYMRDSKGNVRSVVTSYHTNGNPKQFLEILNGRAFGSYWEWHENGKPRVMAKVIGGTADIIATAEKSWLFDDITYAWDEDGRVLAQIPYSQGVLEGVVAYYHSSGKPWKKIPYSKGQIHGTMEIYREAGDLLQQTPYVQGVKHGTAFRFWEPNQIASQEEYHQGSLGNGQYFDKKGQLVAQIKQGTGYRAIFGKDSISELQEYQQGNLEGEIKVFTSQGYLKRIYHVKANIKHGEEVEYYDTPMARVDNLEEESLKPKLSFCWYEGKIHGSVKSWYLNGNLESQREISSNTKNGVCTAWYQDGNLMLIEEYDKDKLIRGDYFKKAEKLPVSQVIQGKGIATLFDSQGHFIQKVTYNNGSPDE